MKTLHLPFPLRLFQTIDFPRKLGIMDRIFGHWLSHKGIVWVQTAAGIPWKLDLTFSPNRWIVYGKYEGAPFLDWARAFLKPDSLVIDSGANIGQMLLYLAQWVPLGKVLAFEPGSFQAGWLRECLAQNPHLPVEVIPLGLGDIKRTACLRECGPFNATGGWNQVSETDGEGINLVRLDDYLVERGIHQVDVWKLDVEGFEIPALQGAETLLRKKLVRALYVELAGANGVRIKDSLAGFGYQCYLFTGNGKLFIASQLPEHTNGLFLASPSSQ